MRSLFSHRDFRLLIFGQGASTLGDRLVFVALAIYVTQIGTPSDVGIVLAVGSGLAPAGLALAFTSGEVRRLAAATSP